VDHLEGSLAFLVNDSPPCVLFEDEHLLVIDKPPGLNTHSPAPFAGEGIYDWLRTREPRWASLAIVHRLDKETSGVMVFTKTPLASRSLTAQFAAGTVRKRYVFLTHTSKNSAPKEEFTVVSSLVRTGSKHAARPVHAGAVRAETRFRVLRSEGQGTLIQAEPITGKTHQIRVHAASQGCPVLGDVLYGGATAPRLCLHAEELTFCHPATGVDRTFSCAADFTADPHRALRAALLPVSDTNAYRPLHGAADGFPCLYADRLGPFLLSQSEGALLPEQRSYLEHLVAKEKLLQPPASAHAGEISGVYHKLLRCRPNELAPATTSPQHILGEIAPAQFDVLENGVRFELSFQEGYSVGLFFDQRDNRRRLLKNYIARDFTIFTREISASEVLNVFSYTCGFSVCAARAGAKTISVDLSRKYLDWGKRNFVLNGLEPGAHEFIYGDAFDWMRRLRKKNRIFDLILLDPPTFSRSREHRTFRAAVDFQRLIAAALPLLRPGGVLFTSTNGGDVDPEHFLEIIEKASSTAGRSILQQQYFPQPPDFPISRAEPAYLKTVWSRIA
jgi:23S rRNA (cytosine1962-C5)-methyltransferase